VTRLHVHPRPEQRPLLAACASSAPRPAERPRAVPAGRLGGRPGIAAEVLAELRAADAPTRVLGSLPSRDLIERLTAVATAMHDDHTRQLDTLAVLDDISAAMAELPYPHAARMLLAPIVAQLAEVA
jgi:hypothetical protein